MDAPEQAHDPEKACPALDAGWEPVFPRDKRGTRLRGDHAQKTTAFTYQAGTAMAMRRRAYRSILSG